MADRLKVDTAMWYDCKLGKMTDRKLAALVGTTVATIQRRRSLLNIEVWSVNQLIEPYRDLFETSTDSAIARLCGASVKSVTTYRQRERLALYVRPAPLQRRQRLPQGHPVRPFKQLLGLVCDEDISRLAGVDLGTAASAREAFGFQQVEATYGSQSLEHSLWRAFQGPWLGYEPLLGTMSDAKVSRAANVPVSVVEKRRIFLGISPFRRISKLEQYRHLVGLVPNRLIAMLAGVSHTRVAQYFTAGGD